MFDTSTITLAGVIVGLFSVLGIASAIQAVMTSRTSQGAIAWAVTLVMWPLVAVPAYWILGRSRFRGYVTARRDRTHGVLEMVEAHAEEIRRYEVDLGAEYPAARVLQLLGQMKFMRGNDTALLIDGEETFDAMFDAIAQAESYVLVEFFIINDDGLGRRLHRLLVDLAKSGVDVYVLYDDIGSVRITRSYVQELVAAGVRVSGMNTTRGRGNRLQLNFRNHRKIVVVDGKLAFVGGLNVGDEYLGKHPKLTPWRDTHMSITGPAALTAQLAFVEDWAWATKQIPSVSWRPQPAPDQDRVVYVLPSGPADQYDTCGLFFTHAINSATQRIWIATPYFVPDEGVITALQLAALRGVDVRILIPGLPDKPFIKLAAMSYVDSVSEAGVQMYEYGDGFLHQKVMLVDEDVAMIGTANFDNRSFRLNFEVSVLTIDRSFADQVRDMLQRDFAKSDLIDPKTHAGRSYFSRFGSRVARLFSPIL